MEEKTLEFKPGSLVSFHGREWVVLPSNDDDLLLLKPMGGTDREIKGVFKGFAGQLEPVQRAAFALPGVNDLGDFATARMLCDAARLSFRSGAGPFRSMGRLSFSPRPYQLVPLIMALKLQTKRLLIADDVGVGKTVEALMIVREMMDRAEIGRFAIVCLPHLCDQWHRELRDKFGIEATLIRSGTVRQLERQLPTADESIFRHYPFQVISIDYIKGDRKREAFLQHLPELVVVDEAHTCARPAGGKTNQQQRHRLVRSIAEKSGQHLLMLTATPHSGKQEEFQSLLGLLDPRFEEVNLIKAGKKHKDEVARHFVQRRRRNVEKLLDRHTPFPKRMASEPSYQLSDAYRNVFHRVLDFGRQLAMTSGEGGNRLRYYLAIGLIRGVMSSPATGEAMLRNRLSAQALENEEGELALADHAVLDGDFDQQEDQAPTEFMDRATFKPSEQKNIRELAKAVAALRGFVHDSKAAAARDLLRELLHTHNTIVFCRYIHTANYLGELLRPVYSKINGKRVHVEVITSELSDEERKDRVCQLTTNSETRKLIIATDCMSEGINLQEHFSAALHYDLPWNPNRLEQREGRIDRFGQPKTEVITQLLYGADNPMDGTVLKVLLLKARKIRQATGISVPFPDDSKSIMDAVLTAVLLSPKKALDHTVQTQIDFGEDDTVRKVEMEVAKSFERAEEREKQITSVFAQKGIKPAELLPYLQETDAVLGNADTVENLLRTALPLFGSGLKKVIKGFSIATTNLPRRLRETLPGNDSCLVSFESPTPEGYEYIGRNHALVEHTCLHILDAALALNGTMKVPRASVFRTNQVDERTTLYLLRIRNVIANKNGRKELVAEEVKLWGFTGSPQDQSGKCELLQAMDLLDHFRASQEVSDTTKAEQLNLALADYQKLRERMDALAEQRAEHMVQGHEQFRKTIEGEQYRTVEPILPPDVLGVYVLLPEIQ